MCAKGSLSSGATGSMADPGVAVCPARNPSEVLVISSVQVSACTIFSLFLVFFALRLSKMSIVKISERVSPSRVVSR